MEQDIQEKFEAQNKKLDEIFRSVERTRKYILWSFIVTVATIVLPLIALVFVIPWFLKVLMSAYGSVGL